MFAVAAIGLGIWAMNAQSDADDAKEQLTAQEQAASEATPEPAPTEAPTEAPAAPAADGRRRDPAGLRGRQVPARRRLRRTWSRCRPRSPTAKKELEAAQQKAADANGAVDKLRAEAEAFKAQAELSKTCLLGTVGALEQTYQSGGLEAAAQQLKALAGDCRAATTS